MVEIGIKDKNGKDIREGDTVGICIGRHVSGRKIYEKSEVVWNEELNRYSLKTNTFPLDSNSIEIIK